MAETEAKAVAQIMAEQEVKSWGQLLPAFLSELNSYRGTEVIRREAQSRGGAKCAACNGSGYALIYDPMHRSLHRSVICHCPQGQFRAEALRTSKTPISVTNLAHNPELKIQAFEIARHHEERARAWAVSVGLDPEAGDDCVIYRDKFREIVKTLATEMAGMGLNRAKTGQGAIHA